MKKNFAFALLIFALFSLNVSFAQEMALEIDVPSFDTIKTKTQNGFNSAKEKTITGAKKGAASAKKGASSIKQGAANAGVKLRKKDYEFKNVQGFYRKNPVEAVKDKSIDGYQGFKKGVKDTVTKTAGRPTDQNLSGKQRKDALLNSQQNGYWGTLPNIEREFNYLRRGSKQTGLSGQYSSSPVLEENLKKAPLDDDLFLDVILKKEKDTQYIKDVLKIATVLERFRTCIDQKCDIQKFNANVNLIDLYAKRLEQDYGNTKESSSESYYLIKNITYLAKLQGNLRYDANYYSRYMPLQGTIYAKENVEKKEQELLYELDKTIFELHQLK